MAPVVTFVSFRLGGDDGVSVEARKWAWALGELGFEVRRVAGRLEGPVEPADVVVPGLAAVGDARAEVAEVAAALDGADLVVAENLCSLPLKVEAARTTAEAVARHAGRVVFHHHDLPWQRRHLAHFEREFPPRLPGALHVTVNLRSRRELHARGFRGVFTIHNRFDFDAPPGERAATRTAFGFADDDLVVLQPGRAIERKNVPGGVRFAGSLAERLPERRVRYWLTGPAEDGYDSTLERVLGASPVPTTVGRAAEATDAYAACDVVVFPSTWEGFGNPVIESVCARRPLAVFPYPVLGEILAFGLRFFEIDDPDAVARFLRTPDDAVADRFDLNLRRARAALSLADLPAALEDTFLAHGWRSW